MKIVICSLNSQYIHSSLAPYCLLAGMKQYGNPSWHTAVIEGTVNEPLDAVCEKIVSAGPDVVGFCCYIWNIKRVYELITMVKARLNSVRIIVGGPEVGYCPSHVLEKSSDIDFVITGEGEKALPLLVSCIETDETPRVAGVSYRGEDGVISHSEEALEEPPSPYSEEYFNQLNGRIAYLETSRGCPYSCAYCLSARCGKLKFYSIQRAKEEILMLAKSGAKTVKFVDRTFNAHRDRAKELFAFIIEHIGKEIPKGVCFHFEIAGDLLDDETVALLQTAPAGSIQLEIGIQSFHKETLSYIRRKTDLEKVIRQVGKLLHKNNIHIHVDLIAGLLLESFSLFRESVNKAY
ncbi:MAG: B12-binding domain-containing radical SAM protein, partial [Clostridia bacterium]|nr:B12-binding domain-containing radical SAM protein [Clostridia bacterium]